MIVDSELRDTAISKLPIQPLRMEEMNETGEWKVRAEENQMSSFSSSTPKRGFSNESRDLSENLITKVGVINQ
jgi:hypothetical protein